MSLIYSYTRHSITSSIPSTLQIDKQSSSKYVPFFFPNLSMPLFCSIMITNLTTTEEQEFWNYEWKLKRQYVDAVSNGYNKYTIIDENDQIVSTYNKVKIRFYSPYATITYPSTSEYLTGSTQYFDLDFDSNNEIRLASDTSNTKTFNFQLKEALYCFTQFDAIQLNQSYPFATYHYSFYKIDNGTVFPYNGTDTPQSILTNTSSSANHSAFISFIYDLFLDDNQSFLHNCLPAKSNTNLSKSAQLPTVDSENHTITNTQYGASDVFIDNVDTNVTHLSNKSLEQSSYINALHLNSKWRINNTFLNGLGFVPDISSWNYLGIMTESDAEQLTNSADKCYLIIKARYKPATPSYSNFSSPYISSSDNITKQISQDVTIKFQQDIINMYFKVNNQQYNVSQSSYGKIFDSLSQTNKQTFEFCGIGMSYAGNAAVGREGTVQIEYTGILAKMTNYFTFVDNPGDNYQWDAKCIVNNTEEETASFSYQNFKTSGWRQDNDGIWKLSPNNTSGSSSTNVVPAYWLGTAFYANATDYSYLFQPAWPGHTLDAGRDINFSVAGWSLFFKTTMPFDWSTSKSESEITTLLETDTSLIGTTEPSGTPPIFGCSQTSGSYISHGVCFGRMGEYVSDNGTVTTRHRSLGTYFHDEYQYKASNNTVSKIKIRGTQGSQSDRIWWTVYNFVSKKLYNFNGDADDTQPAKSPLLVGIDFSNTSANDCYVFQLNYKGE